MSDVSLVCKYLKGCLWGLPEWPQPLKPGGSTYSVTSAKPVTDDGIIVVCFVPGCNGCAWMRGGAAGDPERRSMERVQRRVAKKDCVLGKFRLSVLMVKQKMVHVHTAPPDALEPLMCGLGLTETSRHQMSPKM